MKKVKAITCICLAAQLIYLDASANAAVIAAASSRNKRAEVSHASQKPVKATHILKCDLDGSWRTKVISTCQTHKKREERWGVDTVNMTFDKYATYMVGSGAEITSVQYYDEHMALLYVVRK